MKFDSVGLIGIPIIALVGVLLTWSYGRSIMRGQPLTPAMRKMLLYGFLFVLGGGYSATAAEILGWGWIPWWAHLVSGALLVLAVASWRSQKKDDASEVTRKPISTQLAEGLPVVGMIFCFIGAAIEWDLIYEGQGRWPFGLLWIAGVVATILLARRNRRTTVIVSLRAFIVLLGIGAIANRSLSTLVVGIAVACVLFSVEKIWPNRNDGGVRHIQLF